TTATTTVSGAGNNQTLVQQAQAECASTSNCLTIYTAVGASAWAAHLGPAFYNAFPWAQGKVTFSSLSAATLTTDAISEYQTGKVQADVFEASMGVVVPIIQAGGVQNWTTNPSIQLNNYTTGSYDPEGAWITVFQLLDGMEYNTQLLGGAGQPPIPQNFSALANPIYSGKIAFQTATSISATAAAFYYLYTVMGNSSGQWTNLMNGIAANKPIITTSAAIAGTDVAAGTVAVDIGNYNDYASQKASGAPVGWVWPNPAPYLPSVISLAKNAPHPAMAKLFVEWATSYSGQYAMGLTGRTPYLSTISLQMGLLVPGVTLVNAFENPAIFSNIGGWSTTFKNIFGA
ncbi:MAG: ABC transporter substrate-binding protein, partial [Acidimicrobiales bacterium]